VALIPPVAVVWGPTDRALADSEDECLRGKTTSLEFDSRKNKNPGIKEIRTKNKQINTKILFFLKNVK